MSHITYQGLINFHETNSRSITFIWIGASLLNLKTSILLIVPYASSLMVWTQMFGFQHFQIFLSVLLVPIVWCVGIVLETQDSSSLILRALLSLFIILLFFWKLSNSQFWCVFWMRGEDPFIYRNERIKNLGIFFKIFLKYVI